MKLRLILLLALASLLAVGCATHQKAPGATFDRIGQEMQGAVGRKPRALDDAINTSAILVLMQDDAKFRKTMQPVLDILQPKEDLTSSIGDLCPELAALSKEL